MSAPRLLKVLVRPVFVSEDDDGNLIELVADPVWVSAPDWPSFSGVAFPRMLDNLAGPPGQEATP